MNVDLFFSTLTELDRLCLIQTGVEYTSNVKLRRKRLELHILYESIIKIVDHASKSLIEIKWCNQANNSLVSSYLQYASRAEQHVWMKQLFQKLLYNNLTTGSKSAEIDRETLLGLVYLSDYCQMSLCGFLSLDGGVGSCVGQPNMVFAALVHSDERQLSYFRRQLVLVRQSEPFVEMVDLRKAVVVHSETCIRVDYENRVSEFRGFQ